MTFAGDIFREQDRARTEAALLAVAHRDFHFTGEIHHELAARRVVPIDEILVAVGLAKDDALARDEFRHRRGVARVLHRRLDVLQMGFTIRVGIDARVLHVRSPRAIYFHESFARTNAI